LVSKKSNNAISIISWISVSAIAIGTAALVIILSFMNGLTDMVKDLYNSINPDLLVVAKAGKTFVPDSAKTYKISQLESVNKMNYSIEENALVKYGERQAFAMVKAVGPDFFSITSLEKRIESGIPILKGADGNYIIPGKGLAYELGVNPGNKLNQITLYAPKRGNFATFSVEDALSEESLIPSAYFSINDEFDFKYVIVDIDVGRSLFGYESEVSSLDLSLKPGVSPQKAKKEIVSILGTDFFVKDRFEQNKLLFSTLKTEKLAVFLLLVFILVVATFNIIGSLIMLIAEKKKDLITLNNLGAEISLIRKVFAFEGLLIIFSGAIVGLILGLIVCLLQSNFNLISLSGAGREIPYPVKMIWPDFLLILSGVLIIGSLAIIFPVRFFTRSAVMQKFRNIAA
jgi:lipoprotein-releasing system permease protein